MAMHGCVSPWGTCVVHALESRPAMLTRGSADGHGLDLRPGARGGETRMGDARAPQSKAPAGAGHARAHAAHRVQPAFEEVWRREGGSRACSAECGRVPESPRG
jgi:hypothetical protein